MNWFYFKLFLAVATPTSGALTYRGLISQLGSDDWWTMSLAALTSVSVVLALVAFWTAAMEAVPQIKSVRLRRSAWATIFLGAIFIASLSSYWNVLALTEKEVNFLILQEISLEADDRLNEAVHASGQFGAARGRIVSFQGSIQSMRLAEEQGRGTTGYVGEGPVSNLLLQFEEKLEADINALDAAMAESETLLEAGQECLSHLREAVQFENGGNQVARHVDCVNEVIADLSNLQITALISGAMADITAGAVVPPSVRSPSQLESVRRILVGIQDQADSIAAFADRNEPPPPSFVSNERPNAVEAILKFWRKLIPSISTALALDWLPVVLLVFGSLRQRDAERRGRPTGNLTVSQLHDAQEHMNWLQTPVDRRPGGARRRTSRK